MSPPVLHSVDSARSQRGSFLLESLIAVLIVALGVLGLIGLQARSMQDADESQLRGEAAYLASDIVGQMWTANQITLETDFETGGSAGSPYDNFKVIVHRRLPGASAIANNPDIQITPRVAGNPLFGYDVVVTIRYRPPSASWVRRYETVATVRMN